MSKEKETERRSNEFEVSIPGGIKFTVRGYDVLAFLVAMMFCVMCFFLYTIREEQHKEHAALLSEDQKIKEALVEVVYVLSLTEDERKRLNVAIPESLRKKLKHRNGYTEER